MDNKELFNEQNKKKFKELKTDSSSTNVFLSGINTKNTFNFDNIKRNFNIDTDKFENINQERNNRFKEFLERIRNKALNSQK